MAIGISPLVDFTFKLMLGRQEGQLLGRQEGQRLGRQEGRISILQELLGLPVWTAEEFAACDAAQLTDIADQLQQELRSRDS